MPYGKAKRASLVIIAFASAAVSVVALVRNQSEPNQEVSTSDNEHEHEHSDEEQSASTPQAAAPEGWHREESEHHRTERWYWRASLVITVIAALGAGASAWFAWGAVDDGRKTLSEVRRQADAAVEGNFENNRAWIRFDGFDRPSVGVSPYGVFFNGRLNVKNIGRSPAEHVEAFAALISTFDYSDPVAKALDLCRPGGHYRAPQFEPLVFPDSSSLLLNAGGTMDIGVIRKAREAKARADYTETAQQFGKAIADRNFQIAMTNLLSSSFTVIGCITYDVAGLKRSGFTTFIYDLNRPCRDNPLFPKCTFDLTKPYLYRESDILLERSLGGERAG